MPKATTLAVPTSEAPGLEAATTVPDRPSTVAAPTDAPDDAAQRTVGCVSASIAPDVPAGPPTDAPVQLAEALLPGASTGTRLLLYSVATGSVRRDAILDVDHSTITWLVTDTACGEYRVTLSGSFGVLFAPKGTSDGRTQYKARLWAGDGSSRTFDVVGHDSSIVIAPTWWGLSSTDGTPQLTSVDLGTGTVTDLGPAPDRSAVLVGHDHAGRPVVSTDTQGTFVFDQQTGTFTSISTARTIWTDGTSRVEYDCASESCVAVYRSGARPDLELGPAPYLEVTPSPDSRHVLLVAYNQPSVPVDVIDTTTGERTHVLDEPQGIGPVVWTTWSNQSDWLFIQEAGTNKLMAWHPGMTTPDTLADTAVLGDDLAGLGTMPDG